MAKNSLIVFTLEAHPTFTLEELSHAANVTSEFINELIEYGVIEPQGDSPNWQFDANHLRRIRKALHLQRDLEINFAGIALVLELMEEMEYMRAQMDLFEKHVKF